MPEWGPHAFSARLEAPASPVRESTYTKLNA